MKCVHSDMSHFGDAYLWTSASYFVIGIALLVAAFTVWHTHPVNRVFLFGPYVTQAGIQLLMRYWPLVFLSGAFIFSCGIDHLIHWSYEHGQSSMSASRFFSIIEAVISGLMALCVLLIVARALLRKGMRWLKR